MIEVYEKRREKVKSKMKEKNIETLLVLYPSNRYYLSGFELSDPQCNESAGCLILTLSDKDYLCTDPRYLEAAKRVWEEDNIFIYTHDKFRQLREFLLKKHLRNVGFEENIMTYSMYNVLSKELSMLPCRGIVESVRAIKDEKELEIITRSCAINHKVMQMVCGETWNGMSEAELAWRIESMFREEGAEGMSFSPIVAWGKNSALPHHCPSSQRIEEGAPLLIDVGGRYMGYCSDQTRTMWIGEDIPSFFLETLDLVKRAQQLAIEKIRPGMVIRDLYLLVKSFFQDEGVGDRFTHALGHGIGLDTHELPGIGPKNNNRFRPNMVVTIEPGLYFPQWGGVRWEYMVVIGDEGAKIL